MVAEKETVTERERERERERWWPKWVWTTTKKALWAFYLPRRTMSPLVDADRCPPGIASTTGEGFSVLY